MYACSFRCFTASYLDVIICEKKDNIYAVEEKFTEFKLKFSVNELRFLFVISIE